MAWFCAPASRAFLRRATARAVLISLLLAILTSDRLHNHPGAEGQLSLAAAGNPSTWLTSVPGQTVPGRTLPCPACLYHRTFSMSPYEHAPEGRPAAVLLGLRVPTDSRAPAAPSVARTGPRAPPASC